MIFIFFFVITDYNLEASTSAQVYPNPPATSEETNIANHIHVYGSEYTIVSSNDVPVSSSLKK